MNARFLAVGLLCALPAGLLSCQSKPAVYVDPKGNELIVNVDRMNIQDWGLLADELVQSLVTSGVLERLPNQPAGILLNPVVNNTTQEFDTDGIMKKIRIALLRTGRVQVIMTTGPGGRAEDQIAADTKNYKDFMSKKDSAPDPRTLPDATLTAKLLEDRARSGNLRQVAYVLQMTLTDVNSGRGIWEDESTKMKQGTKSSAGF